MNYEYFRFCKIGHNFGKIHKLSKSSNDIIYVLDIQMLGDTNNTQPNLCCYTAGNIFFILKSLKYGRFQNDHKFTIILRKMGILGYLIIP